MNTQTTVLKPSGFRGLTGTQLKLIALVLMLLDHIHYFFGFTGAVPEWFSMLGRLPAEMFLFFVAEGFVHTHNRKAYFLRVWAIAAAMGLLQFGMTYMGVLNRPDGFVPANGIMMNYVILMVQWQGIDWLCRRRFGRGLAALLLPAVWTFAVVTVLPQLFQGAPLAGNLLLAACYTVAPCWAFILDGGFPYLVGGLLLYALRKTRLSRSAQLGLWGLWLFGYYFVFLWLGVAGKMPDFTFGQMFTTYYEWYCVFCIPLLMCYNGQRGKGMKKLFYVFYPSHVYLLYALSWLALILLR